MDNDMLLLANLPIGQTAEAEIAGASPALLQRLGYQESSLIGRPLNQFLQLQ